MFAHRASCLPAAASRAKNAGCLCRVDLLMYIYIYICRERERDLFASRTNNAGCQESLRSRAFGDLALRPN